MHKVYLPSEPASGLNSISSILLSLPVPSHHVFLLSAIQILSKYQGTLLLLRSPSNNMQHDLQRDCCVFFPSHHLPCVVCDLCPTSPALPLP